MKDFRYAKASCKIWLIFPQARLPAYNDQESQLFGFPILLIYFERVALDKSPACMHACMKVAAMTLHDELIVSEA